jgi:hypothetical protein
MNLTALSTTPMPVMASGKVVEEHYWEFFGGRLRNWNRRRTYVRAVENFFAFLQHRCLCRAISNS